MNFSFGRKRDVQAATGQKFDIASVKSIRFDDPPCLGCGDEIQVKRDNAERLEKLIKAKKAGKKLSPIELSEVEQELRKRENLAKREKEAADAAKKLADELAEAKRKAKAGQKLTRRERRILGREESANRTLGTPLRGALGTVMGNRRKLRDIRMNRRPKGDVDPRSGEIGDAEIGKTGIGVNPLIDGDGDGKCQEESGKWIPCPPRTGKRGMGQRARGFIRQVATILPNKPRSEENETMRGFRSLSFDARKQSLNKAERLIPGLRMVWGEKGSDRTALRNWAAKHRPQLTDERIDEILDGNPSDEEIFERLLGRNPDKFTVGQVEGFLIEERAKALEKYFRENSAELLYRAGMIDEDGKPTKAGAEAGYFYHAANRWGTQIAEEYDVEPEAVFAIMAIHSQKTRWDRNAAQAEFAVQMMSLNPVIESDVVSQIRDRRELLLLKRLDGKPTAKNRKQYEEELALIERTRSLGDDGVKEYGEYIGLTPGKRLRDQTPFGGGNALQHFERNGYGDIPAPMAKNFNVTAERDGDGNWIVPDDGDLAIADTEGVAHSAHQVELVHGRSWRVLKEAIDGRDSDVDPETGEEGTFLAREIDAALGQQSKVRSFFSNISDPTDTAQMTPITVDTWIGGGALGMPGTSGSSYVKGGVIDREGMSGTGPLYAIIADAVIDLSNEIEGASPSETNQMLWAAARMLYDDLGEQLRIGPREAAEDAMGVNEQKVPVAETIRDVRKMLWGNHTKALKSQLERLKKEQSSTRNSTDRRKETVDRSIRRIERLLEIYDDETGDILPLDLMD